jgi:glutamate--cysteine ligase
MSTMDRTGSLDPDIARSHITRQAFSERLGGSEVGRVGLEPEYFVLRRPEGEAGLRRLPLEGPSSVLSALERLAAEGSELRLQLPGPPPVYELPNGGRITFEPGAQVEHSTTIHGTAAQAMDDVDRVARVLEGALALEDSVLGSAGIDLWTERRLVPQQLRAPRYRSMAAYLEGRSEHGRIMMRHTGSFQVNLDLGEADVARERWVVANLLCPIATASFACSTEGGWKSRRAAAWQGLDPTRTGFPGCLVAGRTTDPGACYAELALGADVLLFRGRGSEAGSAVPGTPGFSFQDWIEGGHPEHGRPTLEDLDYHLTTIFPEVRLRGFFEIRSADAVPLRWRAAQVVFWTGLLYDPEAREHAERLLAPGLAELPEAWVRAAREGLEDPELQLSAGAVWRLALEGARRLPDGFHRPGDLEMTEAFVERFVARGRCPGDELAELLDEDPLAALEWTRESV